MFFKLIKFGIVGCSGLFIDFGLTFILKEKLAWNKFLANSVGFCVAVLSNYFLDRIWTFHNTDPKVVRQLFLFVMIGLAGLAINNGVLYFFNEKKKFNFYFSKLLAVVIVFFWNFSINNFVTFK